MVHPLGSGRLRKELGLFDVWAVALGTTLGAGFFLLPGLAVEEAGPAVVLAYAVASLPLVPALFAVVELATAMPRAGGTYYFLDRALGPAVGTIGGLGTWLALVLKTSFALVGMGAYLALFLPELPVRIVAVAVALALGGLNAAGARRTGRLQVGFVLCVVVILLGFVGAGLLRVDPAHFAGAGQVGARTVLSTAGLVYVSYIGVTKIASLAEEVRDPERNLPRGLFLAMGTAVAAYVLGTTVMVGVLGTDAMSGNLTAAGTAGGALFGWAGEAIVSAAALLASISVANAGILAASRYPLAMSRDHVLPAWLSQLSGRGTPLRGVLVSVGSATAVVLALDPMHIAELAGAFQLLMFSLLSLAVIVMRESRIASYDPGFRSPLYPWMQLAGIGAPLYLIAEMGAAPMLFSLALVAGGGLWYRLYAHGDVMRSGAIFHVFERLGRRRFTELDTELRGILKEKGLREADPFDEIVQRSSVIDVEGCRSFEEIVGRAAADLAHRIGQAPEDLARGFLEGTRIGATPVEHGVAIPHLRQRGIQAPELVLVRAREGVEIELPVSEEDAASRVTSYALFFLVSPEGDASQHLRLLAHLAAQVEEPGFMSMWTGLSNPENLREILLQSECLLSVHLEPGTPSGSWIDLQVHELRLPRNCLIALVLRDGRALVPRGGTLLLAGDRLTVIGDAPGIRSLRRQLSAAPEKREGNGGSGPA